MSSQGCLLVGKYPNRKEGNDQESKHLPNTFRPRHQREKNALKATAPQVKQYKQKAKRTVSSQIIGQTNIRNKRTHQDIHA